MTLDLNIYEGEIRGIIDAALHTEKETASPLMEGHP